MRGKAKEAMKNSSFRRITPAHAGKRISGFNLAITHKDHPRPCGEKVDIPAKSVEKEGSPPPMRGKDHLLQCTLLRLGITPAHAGKRCIIGLFRCYN